MISVTSGLFKTSMAGFLNNISKHVNIPNVTLKFVVNVFTSVPGLNEGS